MTGRDDMIARRVHGVLRGGRRTGGCGVSADGRGMVLLAVLGIVAVLAVLAATFAFQMRANLTAMTAVSELQQAQLAAEAGIQRVILMLQEDRTNVDTWWNNRDDLGRILVWAPGQIGGSSSLADKEAIAGQPAWRFSIVGWYREGDKTKMRYGITPESSKLNLNTASREHLLRLFDQLELKDEVTSEQLTDALIDWRDKNDVPISQNGAESSYYITLDPPYRAKDGPLRSVEELLMVKGFNGAVLWGEDYNRNGYLDENEDDGEEGVFPPDDADGVLDEGIYPFVTVYSWDLNSGNDNRPRLDLNSIPFKSYNADAGEGEVLIPGIPPSWVEDLKPEWIQFIGEAQKRGFKFRSAGELLGLEVFEDGSSNYDEAWKTYRRERRHAERSRMGEEEEEGTQESGQKESAGSESGDGKQTQDEEKDEVNPDTESSEKESEDRDTSENASRDNASRADDDENDGEAESSTSKTDRKKRGMGAERIEQKLSAEDEGSEGKEGDREAEGEGESKDGEDGTKESDKDGGKEDEKEGEKDGDDESGAAGDTKGEPIVSPLTPEDMAIIMDRLSAIGQSAVAGQINVNTAPREVLLTVPGLTEEQVGAILATRSQLDGEDKATIAWLAANGVLDAETFAVVCNDLTARAMQFTVEAVGFADHVGAVKRIEVVVEMQSQMPQIRYYRDVSPLGVAYPVWNDEPSEGGFGFEN